MEKRVSADIITFPRPAGEPTATDAQLRLRNALAALNVALGMQREAVSAWRGAVGDLSDTMQKLSRSLRGYRANLDRLAPGDD